MRTGPAWAIAGTLLIVAGELAGAVELLEDVWFRLTVSGAHVGHAHRTVEALPDGGTLTSVTTGMEVRRLGEAVSIASAEQWFETPNGLPIAYHLTRDMGVEETRLSVRVEGDRLLVTKSAAGAAFVDTVRLDGRLLFPEGQRRLHASRGFDPGDRYEFLVYDPDFERVSRHAVSVIGTELLPGGSDSLEVHRLSGSSELYPDIEFVTWLDGEGRVWAESVPALGLVSERTTRESAVRVEGAFDIIVETMIPTNERIGRPSEVDEALYEVWVEGADASFLVPEDDRQTIEGTTDRGVLLRVRRTTPASSASAAPASLDEYLQGNALLQVDDPRIRSAAAEAVGGDAATAWESALRIERYVHDTMQPAGFGLAFASALEVLEHRAGDCSEHAVLAAALARAVGVPSRVVSGLVHVDGRFAYHMWIEVWAGGRWYALDPTIGVGSADATHIKLADSSLEGGAVGELSLAVMRAMNRLRVNVVEYSSEGKAAPGAAD